MKKSFFKKSHRGIIPILIAVAVIILLSIGLIAAAAIMVGDRTGAGSGSSDPSGAAETDAPIVEGGCSDAITAARSYLNKGIYYSQAGGRCGPSNSKGPDGVRYMDCSGYISRVFRDAGLMTMNSCINTVGFAYSSSFQRIATTPEQAKSLWQPGDFLLFGLGNPAGSPIHSDYSHIVMFGGSSGGRQIIYESGGSGGGPHVSIYNVFGGGRAGRFYGLYRATRECSATEAATPGS